MLSIICYFVPTKPSVKPIAIFGLTVHQVCVNTSTFYKVLKFTLSCKENVTKL